MINAVGELSRSARLLRDLCFVSTGTLFLIWYSRMGIPNARVLPEPVEAFPITSCPLTMSGIADDCIAVGFLKRIFAREASTERERHSGSHAETGCVSKCRAWQPTFFTYHHFLHHRECRPIHQMVSSHREHPEDEVLEQYPHGKLFHSILGRVWLRCCHG